MLHCQIVARIFPIASSVANSQKLRTDCPLVCWVHTHAGCYCWVEPFGDDHAHIAFTAMHPDEKTPQAVAFLRNAVAYSAGLGVSIKRLLTDNGAAFRSRNSPRPARPWAHSTSSPGRIGHRPTARPSDSSNRRCASGPMVGHTRIELSEHKPYIAGSITTTGTGLTAVLVELPRWPGSNLQTTS